MAILAEFDADAARRVLNAIGRGEGILAPASGHWTDRHAMLTAACLMMATRASAPAPKEPIHKEHAEAREVTIQSDISLALVWLADRAQDLQRGVYYDHFEPIARVVIASNPDSPHVEIIALEGVKTTTGGGESPRT